MHCLLTHHLNGYKPVPDPIGSIIWNTLCIVWCTTYISNCISNRSPGPLKSCSCSGKFVTAMVGFCCPSTLPIVSAAAGVTTFEIRHPCYLYLKDLPLKSDNANLPATRWVFKVITYNIKQV